MQETNQTTKRTKSYTCELCQKVFTQKIDYTRHTKKKNACVSLNQLQEIVQTEQVIRQTINDEKTTLINIFKACLNILRDNEALTGPTALRQFSNLLVLKLLEDYFNNGTIDIDSFEYDFSEYDLNDEKIEENKCKLLHIARFSNLSIEPEENIPHNIKCLYDIILSTHNLTKHVFLKENTFKIVKQITYKNLINKLNELPITNNDILGDAYEEVIKDIMTGKVFGQYFTPPQVKKLAIQLINPQIHENGTIETCCDPTMGTGGFLIEYLKYVIKESKNKNIQLDWDFIKTQGIYGKEIEPNTYQLAMSNMLISSGYVFEHLERGDSIRNPITQKFDNILANPPFGIKFNYDEIQLEDDNIKKSYIPIKTDNAVSLFIQAIIYMLNIDGKCAIVLPNGQEFYSKTNKTFIHIREYLMKTCDLKEIIYLPPGTFTYTTIRTCVFYFIKKVEGNEAMEIKFKKNKNTNVETKTDYKFSDKYQTSNIKFYDCYFLENKECVKNLLVEVPIEKIAYNLYSLYYAEYLESDTNDENIKEQEDGIIMKTLGEFCKIIKGEKKRSKNAKKTGLYPLYYCSILGNLYLDTYDYTDEGIIINKTNGTGKAMVYYGKNNYNVGESTIHFKSFDNNLLTKYIYYYLLNNINLLEIYFKGPLQKSIIEEDLFKIKIPIPSLDKQNEIIQYLDFIYEKSNKTSKTKINELKQLNKFCLNNEIKYGSNIVKTLDEICNFKNGKGIKKDRLIEGEYPVIGGGQKPMGFHNKYNTNENTILCSSSGAYAGFISKYDKKVWASDCFSIIPKDKSISNNYLYYFLKITQNKIYNTQTGLAQPHVYSKDLKNLIIPIPSLKKQRQIIEYCDRNCELIKQLENEIENNKKIAKQFLNNVLKITNDMPVENETIDDDEDCHLKTCGLEEEEEEEKEEMIVKKGSLKLDDEEDDETEYDCEFED
jgi:type I restriction-modification system DNA methylase subunit